MINKIRNKSKIKCYCRHLLNKRYYNELVILDNIPNIHDPILVSYRGIVKLLYIIDIIKVIEDEGFSLMLDINETIT